MKNNKIKIFFTLWILLGSFSLFFNYSQTSIFQGDQLNEPTDNVEQPKIAYFNNSMKPISINDLPGSLTNWTWAGDQPWCNGSGLWNDPYVIENLTINIQDSGSGIEIKNSIKFFRIKNCTVYNSTWDTGINLDNVSNGLLIGNELYDNYNGIFLTDGSNNNISRNSVFNNNENGIGLINSNNNNISRNSVFNNTYRGIILWDSNYNNISRNTVFNNTDGIDLSNSHYNNVSRNTVYNSDSGIKLRDSNYNNVSRNIASDNNQGIFLVNSLYNNVSRNVANNNNIVGIALDTNCDYNNITWNEARYNGDNGIYLYNSSYNTISNNFLSKNDGGAIDEVNCIINFIKDNIVSNVFYMEPFVIDDDGDEDYTWAQASTQQWWCSGNGTFTNPYVIINVTVNGHNSDSGIEIRNTNVYFRIENCNIYNSSSSLGYAGIKLESVGNGTLIFNDFSNNGNNGILLTNSNNNTISNNTINNSGGDGITLEYSSNNNNITGNILNNNQQYGIFINECANNTLLENRLSDCGIFIGGGDIKKFSHTIDTSNKVNNKILYYYISVTNLGFVNFSNAGQVLLVNVNDSLISNLDVSHGSVGISLTFCNNVTVFNNTASNNNLYGILLIRSNKNNLSDNVANYNGEYGIYLFNCVNITLTGNNMTYCGLLIIIAEGSLEMFYSHSIDSTNHVNDKHLYYYVDETFLNPINFTDAGQIILYNCNNSLISNLDLSHGSSGITLILSNNNTISNINSSYNTNYGIYLFGLSNKNTIYENILNNNGDYGIFLTYSSNENNIRNNIINENDGIGIYLDSFSNNNYLYYNDFNNNGQNAKDGSSNNVWDDGEIGNYWGDYSGMDTNNDGIGDFNYSISGSGNANDTKPLMFPVFDDTDGDGLLNLEEYTLGVDQYRTNVTNPDSDYDGLTDYWEAYYSTNPWDSDTDGDNMPDYWETQNSLDANVPNSMGDADNDLLLNLFEFLNGTNPQLNDTDYDLISDYDEILGTLGYITNATISDTDKDGLLDGYEYGNYTNPLDPDTDNDNLLDGDEILGNLGYITNATNKDTDGDGLRDDFEYGNNTHPLNPDTDGDSFNDFDEIAVYNTNALDNSWYPMPNLVVYGFTVSTVNEGQPFVLNFTITNNGIWKAENIIVIIRCEILNLTLYDSVIPFNFSIDQTIIILIGSSALNELGSYALTLTIDPDNLINERYSSKGGSLRDDWEEDNTDQTTMYIIAVEGGGGDGNLIIPILTIGSSIAGASIGLARLLYVRKPRIKKKKYSKKQKIKAKLELENFKEDVRDFVYLKLEENYHDEWWEKGIPENIRIAIGSRIQAEKKFIPKMKTQYRELLELNHFYPIISEKNNWDEIFSEIFPDKNDLKENFDNLSSTNNNLSQKVATPEEINNYPLYLYSIMNFITKGFNIFLSYSTKDSDHFQIPEIVARLKDYPKIDNVLYWEVDSGEDIVKFMERSLRISKVFILFCTEKSIKSKAVEDEWEAAFQLRKKGMMKIVPVYEDEKDIPILLMPLLNVKYDKDNFDDFIEKLSEEIMRKKK